MSEPVIRPIIGLEIHVQLATRTKMFCGCPLEFGAEPNSRVCPVCGGLPGALPVINRQAVEFALRTALALNCTIGRLTKWDRKNYFYPDLPKNYQVSQYDLPIGLAGRFDLPNDGGATRSVRIRRVHLEEDAGKNSHEGLPHTRVDLNRAGTPLLEIVTEPDLADGEETARFCVELQRLVRHLGVSEADMQKGQMRFEPNINLSIQTGGADARTPITEVKNLNSFRAVQGAVTFEIRRQADEWRGNRDYTLEKVGKLNYGWNDARGVTEFQRGKEEAHDYRYLPDPDLVPMIFESSDLERGRAALGELPLQRRHRWITQRGMAETDAETLLADRATADLFDAAAAAGADSGVLCKQMISFWSAEANARGASIAGLGVSAAQVAELATLTAGGDINATTAAAVAAKVLVSGRGPREIVEVEGLRQVRDENAAAQWVDEAIAANPKAVADYRSNPKKAQAAIGFLRGQVMKISAGKADPRQVGEMIEKRLTER